MGCRGSRASPAARPSDTCMTAAAASDDAQNRALSNVTATCDNQPNDLARFFQTGPRAFETDAALRSILARQLLRAPAELPLYRDVARALARRPDPRPSRPP